MANATHRNTENLEVWQWNCRTLRNKHAALAQYIQSAPVLPDIICLQEIGQITQKLKGYETYSNPDYPRVATFARKDLALSVTYMPQHDTQHQILTVWPCKRNKAKTVIVNIYSAPRERAPRFDTLIIYAISDMERKDKLLVVGDFNAPHSAWGYNKDSVKGKLLVETTDRYGLELITIPGCYTRLGNSVAADTTPDLAFSSHPGESRWTNLEENLGSDHNIVSIGLNSPKIRRTLGRACITDWTVYRDKQEQLIFTEDIETWVEQIRETHGRATREITTTSDITAVDSRLIHLWEARRSLTRRWKRQRLNRKLKIRIAQLTQEANAYAQTLENTNWHQFCESLHGTLHTKKTWAILRSMIDPANTKTATNRALRLLECEFRDADTHLLATLEDIYI